jgi:uncharacterized protein (TIGR02246 family)
MTQSEQLARTVLDAYQAAVHAKDADALMALYIPDVRVFDAWGVWSYEGKEAWRKPVQNWFSSLGKDGALVEFEDVRIHVMGATLAVSAIARYAGVSADDGKQKSMHNRLTWVLQVDNGVARIAHEHTSAPIDFDNNTAILQRNPEA